MAQLGQNCSDRLLDDGERKLDDLRFGGVYHRPKIAPMASGCEGVVATSLAQRAGDNNAESIAIKKTAKTSRMPPGSKSKTCFWLRHPLRRRKDRTAPSSSATYSPARSRSPRASSGSSHC